jgi:protein phosphatase
MQLRHAVATDNGRARDHNEDAFQIETKPARAGAGALFVVCDGMGGFASGEVASELAAKTIVAHYYATSAPDPGIGLRGAFDEANRRVWSEGRGKMGTTGVAALFIGDAALLANVGDSRAYLLRAGVIRQLTSDHSFVAEQVVAGMLTADEARTSSYRNIITRALGHREHVDVDLFLEQVQPGDRILLCSDGLHGLVESEEILELAGDGPVQDGVDDLVMLANERGGTDNITAVLIEVVAVEPGRTPSLPTQPARPQAATGRGGTMRDLTGAPAGGGNGTTRTRNVAPVRPRGPVAPPMPAPARRGPVVGLLLMTLLALALLAGMAYVFVNNGLALDAPVATPTIPALTPPGPAATLTVEPTLVPTAAATMAAPLAPSP